MLVLLLVVLSVGRAFTYIEFIKYKQGAKISANLNDYEFEGKNYENMDVPEQVNASLKSEICRMLSFATLLMIYHVNTFVQVDRFKTELAN